MHDFVRELIAFRRTNLHAFAPSGYGAGAPFAWKSADNSDDVAWDSRHLMKHYHDATAGAELAILINQETGPITFTLPSSRTWHRVLDTQAYFDTSEYLAGEGKAEDQSANFDADETAVGASYQVEPRSIVILRAE